ncbi:hypothetical protein Syun_020986 [Stephania yunnanensis]|uniref:Uncharacterized protein n=1 Tax=Stephania yunnanensis TaxID=152371 RepID=A0AAP0NQ88_9MAGN
MRRRHEFMHERHELYEMLELHYEHVPIKQVVKTVMEPGGSKGRKQLGSCFEHYMGMVVVEDSAWELLRLKKEPASKTLVFSAAALPN